MNLLAHKPAGARLIKFIQKLGLILLFGTIFNVATNHVAQAADSNISGTVNGITGFQSGFVWAEVRANDNWSYISGSQYQLSNTGSYSLGFNGLAGSPVRVNSYVKLSTGSYVTLGDSFTATTGSTSINLSTKSLNLKFTANPAIGCSGSYIYLEDVGEAAWDSSKEIWVPYQLNQSGVLNLSAPSGYTYTAYLNCSGTLSDSATVTTSNTLQNITFNAGTANISGTISGITSEEDVYAYIESQTNEEGQNLDEWEYRYELFVKSDGKYAAKVPDGTYRIKVMPNATSAMADYVVTYSDTFTVASNTITKNFTLSNTANLILDITPNDIAVGSEYNIRKKVVHPIKGTAYQWISWGSVSTNGKIKSNLEPGTYQINITPKSNRSGYVQTTISDIVISSTGIMSQTVALAQANLVFKVNLDPGTTGWIEGGNSDWSKTFSGEIGADGYARVLAEAGTYIVSITPNNPTKSKTGVRIFNFVVTGSAQQEEVNLQPANIIGTISPSSKVKQAYVTLWKKIEDNWDWYNANRVDAFGGYFFYGDNGEYKIEVSCWGKSVCTRTFSSPFTIASDSKTVNLTIATGNVTGTVSPTDRSKYGSISVQATSGTQMSKDFQYWAQIGPDGTFELLLPKGKYKLRAEPTCNSDPCVSDYAITKSDEFEVVDTATAVVKNITLLAPNVTGTIYPTSSSRGGIADVDRLVAGNWEWETYFPINKNGTYSLYLEPGAYQFRIRAGNLGGGVSNLKTDSITVTSSLQTFNFTLPSSNFQAQLTPAASAAYASVTIEKLDNISGNKYGNQWIQASSDGKIEAYLAPGKYRLHIDPRSEGVSQTVTDFFTMPDTTTLTTFTFALNVPNVTGTVTPEASSRYSSVCFETYENGIWTGQYNYCTNTDYTGKFKVKVGNGTYRAIINPSGWDYEKNVTSSSKYAQTISESFTIADNTKNLTIALSTGNVKGTVSPIANSAYGTVIAYNSEGNYLKGGQFYSQIDANGNYVLNLPDGKYRLQVHLQGKTDGSINTQTDDFTASSVAITKNIALDTPTITGQVTPVEKSRGGWVNAEQYTCKCGWSGWAYAPGIASSSAVDSDGRYEIKVQDGLTRIVAYPNWEATGVTRTYSDSFTATSAPRIVNIALSSGNISGTISTATNSEGGWINVQKLNDWGWSWGGGTQIKSDGSYNINLESGTYRFIAIPGWRSSGVVETVSDTFTATTGVSTTVNFSLEAPNVSGTISNLADNVSTTDFAKYGISDKQYINAAHASIVQQDSSGNWIWSGRSFGIKGNGSYSIHLKPGTYKFYIHNLPEFVTNLTGDSYTDSFTVTGGSSTTFNFALPGSNLKGTITPTTGAGWGWVCAQKYESSKDYWYSQKCSSVKSNGTYELKLDDGTYRIEANPNWSTTGYARTYSDSFTVTSALTTKDLTLTPTNVQLVVLDVSGNPNWQGTVEVRDASGNWVDTFKHGWISDLGKVDFKLAAGTYTLNIQPGQYATGIRTTTTITVPATGNFTATISLVDGNVQGTALKTGSPSLPCGLVVATAAGKTSVKTITRSDGKFTLNLESNVTWTITVTDPATGNSATSTITPGASSTNPVTVTVS